MKTLIEYLEMVGQASGKEILEYMGRDWDTTELFDLVEEGRVSSSYGSRGARYFRYPAVGAVNEREENNMELLTFIRDNPAMDGKGIQEELDWSKDKFFKRLTPLLDDGSVVRVKDGVSWRYSMNTDVSSKPAEVKPVAAISEPPTDGDGDGRFKKELNERELTQVDIEIMNTLSEYPDDDREPKNMHQDMKLICDWRTFLKAVGKLYRDGYIGKVVDGDSTMYCTIDRV